MQKFKLVFSLLLFFASSLLALEAPSIKLHNSHLKAITLTSMQVDTQIIANIAISTYELSFYNPNNQVIEGELNFALMDGANVIDYALEINGKWRQASIVPKAKAKEAYEDTIRQKIDPSLLEKTVGNNFKTRLYPIPAKGYKKIQITIQELLPTQKGKTSFTMPFVSKHKLEHFALNIHLPSVKHQTPVEIEGITFDKGSQGQSYRFEKSNFKIKEPISIAFENPTTIQTFSQKLSTKTFYFSSIPYTLQNKERTLPKKIAIVYNTSFSNKERDIDKELAFLKEYLYAIKDRHVEVICFSNDITQRQRIDINNQGFEALAKVLKSARYDGTSNFGVLDISKIQADAVLLFSNGIKTLYEGNPKKINKPLITINSSLKSDTAVLKAYAKRSHGRFIDLLQRTPKQAVETLKTNQPIITITQAKGFKKEESTVEYQDNQIQLFTRSTSPKGSIDLTIQDGEKSIQQTIDLSQAYALGNTIATLWAAKRIDTLSFEYDKNRAYIDKVAKYYKVLTKDMSLIVLDRVADYVKHEITPPQELLQEYKKLLAQKDDAKLYEKEQALIESIRLLQDQKQWYAKKFPKTKRPEVKVKEEERGGEEGGDIVEPAPVVELALSGASKEDRSNIFLNPISDIASKTKKSAAKPKPKKLEIALKAFDPNTIYLKKLKELKKPQWLHAYEMMKDEYIDQPIFYVDVASFFYQKGMKRMAIRVLSNVVELDFDKSEFLRLFGFKAREFNANALAIKAFERVKNLRPFEPQSFRDLALAYEQGKKYQLALDTLYFILVHTWDGRFNGIKIVVINEMNALIAKHKVNTKKIDRRLLAKMPMDLRVVINWSTDNSDMDLWVTDPYGEKTYYSNKLSYIGAKISNDITGGYGPEEFMIKDAVKGKYKIEVNYYGSREQHPTIPVTIRAEVYTHYGKKIEKGQDIVVRVGNQSKVVEIGEIKY